MIGRIWEDWWLLQQVEHYIEINARHQLEYAAIMGNTDGAFMIIG